MRPRWHERGLTLIEMMIALIVVAGLMALVVPSIQSVAGVKVREEAGRLSGTIAYLYNHAAVSGRTCRLTFTFADDPQDLEAATTYEAECTKGSPRLSTEKTRVRDGAADPGFKRIPDAEQYLREEQMEEQRIKAGPQWEPFGVRGAEATGLPSGVRIAGLWTPRLDDVVTAGKTHLYFFPLGETQRAYVWLTDPHDNYYTLTVQPLTGRTRVFNENLEVPDE